MTDVTARLTADLFPTVSPDGRWLAYASDESGRFEIYVRPFPDTRTAKRQVSVAGGTEPRWSRDGREGVPKTLFADVSPDGKRFLLARPIGTNRPNADELILVENFFQELKAKVKK